jgi:hypothetical protein
VLSAGFVCPAWSGTDRPEVIRKINIMTCFMISLKTDLDAEIPKKVRGYDAPVYSEILNDSDNFSLSE